MIITKKAGYNWTDLTVDRIVQLENDGVDHILNAPKNKGKKIIKLRFDFAKLQPKNMAKDSFYPDSEFMYLFEDDLKELKQLFK